LKVNGTGPLFVSHSFAGTGGVELDNQAGWKFVGSGGGTGGDPTPNGNVIQVDFSVGRVYVDTVHGLSNGDIVLLAGIVGPADINHKWSITVIAPMSFTLDGYSDTGTLVPQINAFWWFYV